MSENIEKKNCFYSFDKDLKVATETEKELANFIAKKYNLTIVDFCKDSRYDVLMENPRTSTYLTFEFKEEFTHAKTGNIGLEYFCRGKPSGINTSKADFYVYKIHNKDKTFDIYLIEADTLREMIRDNVYFRKVNGGDPHSDSLNFLFKDSDFYRYATKLSKDYLTP